AAGEEVTQVLGNLPVLLGSDPSDARSRALVDVAEQAGSTRGRSPPVDTGRAGPDREDPQQGVEGLPDRPGVRIRTEVAGALALGPPQDLSPGDLLAHGDSEIGIRLVVAVLDVEAWLGLFDPGVLQL